MSKFVLSAIFILFSATLFVGCGGSGQNKNVVENADAKALADYQAEEKAREEAMKASQPNN